MPCLNEADTIAIVIEKAQRAIRENGIAAEIVIADNGSTDGSQDIARALGVRVVAVEQRGYGAALMGGINAVRGTYVIMGDADDSYDWGEIPRFLAKLREGFDLVQGCRLETGGGIVEPGAMPFLHRWWGNPMFSALARWWFRTPIHDIHCGMRAFRRDMWLSLDQRCTGMEFASEMVIKASLFGAKTAEIPVTLSPDGRTSHPPHLKTFRDGWRHLRFFLLFSPRWLFLMPGLVLILAGAIGYALAMPQVRIGAMTFDVHTLLFASLAIICGYQSIAFALMTKVFAIVEGLLPEDPRLNRFFRVVNLESGLTVGALGMLVGLGLLGAAVHQWSTVDFGELNYEHTMRWVIPGVMLTALGFQTILSSFFASLMGMRRR
ncbi:MAG TPA: glycosyltransferase family 2 protein [Gemmatimonadaceae bacterium]|nr:glycosyltransferase family 2 protein [Gemmatimonadaceae bacterium]